MRDPSYFGIGVLVFRPDETPLGYLICLMHASHSSGSCELDLVRDGTVQRVFRASGCVTIGPGDFAWIVMEPETRYIR